MKPRPALDGLSIGFRCTDAEHHKAGSGPGGARRTIKGVDLVEVSLVTFPANLKARVVSVKAHGEPEATMQDLASADFERMRDLMQRSGR
jgi:uncharacterized protein